MTDFDWMAFQDAERNRIFGNHYPDVSRDVPGGRLTKAPWLTTRAEGSEVPVCRPTTWPGRANG